jgi:hypothetical protein
MASISIGSFVTGFHDAFSDSPVAIDCDTTIECKISLPANVAAQTGTITSSVVTLSGGHGLTTGDVVDVYWTGGIRYGCTTTVVSNEVTLAGGAGDTLPTGGDTVTVVEQVDTNINFDGDDMKVIAVIYRNDSDSDASAHIDFQDTSDASINELDLLHETSSGGMVRTQNVLNISGGDTNTFTGNRITHAAASHNSLYAADIFVKLGYDA